MKRFFCTYFDYNFLPRGLTLFQSIKANCPDFTLFLLALDERTEIYLQSKGYNEINIISLKSYKSYFNVDESKYRSHKEFFFSITPNICLFVLEQNLFIDILWYIDADTCFFNDVEYLYKELGEASIGICPHRSSKFYQLVSTNYGVYNVGVNAFKNDEEGIRCLQNWKMDCETWSYDDPSNKLTFFSDQIFLDNWEANFLNVKVIKHLGINAAPWNMMHNKLIINNNRFVIGDQPLVIFHFASLKKVDHQIWTAMSARFFTAIKDDLLTLYQSYINNLEGHGLPNQIVAGLGFDAGKFKQTLKYILRGIFNEQVKINEN